MDLTFDREDSEGLEQAVSGLIERFEADTGRDGWVGYQLLHLKWAYLDGRLDRWTTHDLDDILRELFPAKVLVDDGDIQDIPADAQAFLRWFADNHTVGGDPLPRLLEHLARTASAIIAAQRDASRFSLGKMLATQMTEQGVEVTDHDAVQSFMADFNALPEDERKRRLPVPGDPGQPPLDDPPRALPPYLPVDPATFDAAASAAPLFTFVAGFVDFIGSGVKLTKTGNLRLADAKVLVNRLGIDPTSPIVEDLDTLRSAGDIDDLDLTFRLAISAGFAKIRHGTVSVTKRHDLLGRDPAAAWLRLVDGLIRLGVLHHRYRFDGYVTPPWIERVDGQITDMLMWLYEAPDAIPVAEMVEICRSDLARRWQLTPPVEGAYNRGDIWWELVESNVRLILDRLALLGVLDVALVEFEEQSYGLTKAAGGEVGLTAIGRVAVAHLAAQEGMEVREAGVHRDLDVAGLIPALANMETAAAEVELTAWLASHPAEEALDQIVTVIGDGVEPDHREVTGALLLGALARTDPRTVGGGVDVLADNALFGPLVDSWRRDHGEDVGAPEPLAALISIAGLGGGADAVIGLSQQGSATQQRELIEQARGRFGADAVPMLQAVADLHQEKQVAKEARKALFRLGVRR